MAEVKLMKAELVMMLDAKIRRRAGYRFRGDSIDGFDVTVGSLGMTSFDDEAVAKVAANVYDDIIADFADPYSENLVKATRAVRKFNKAYVRRVIKAGIKDGSVQLEALVASRVEDALARTEGLPSWLKKKIDGKKGKDDEKDKGKKKKKGLPPWLKKKGE